MLKTVFIASKSDFDQVLVHWLARHTQLLGVVWTQSTAWQRSWRGRWRFARRRANRYGLVKVFNETLFYLYYHARGFERDQTALWRDVIAPYHAAHGVPRWTGDQMFAANLNAPEVLSFLESRQPDLGFAMCVSDYFGRKLRAIPKQGMFLWHEGITPEYRGLYSPFWAVHNLDFAAVGYTLLRMDDSLDAGAVYVQGRARDVDPWRHGHLYLGHKAIMDSLPGVERLLRELESGTARPVERTDAIAGTYTYPGLSDLLRQQWRLWASARSARASLRRE